jgi:hypothetical protein
MTVEGGDADGRRTDVVELCAAVRQALDDLYLDEAGRSQITNDVAAAERLAQDKSSTAAQLAEAVRPVRYLLLEMAQGPLAPFLADAAAQIIGDGHGRLFFK